MNVAIIPESSGEFPESSEGEFEGEFRRVPESSRIKVGHHTYFGGVQMQGQVFPVAYPPGLVRVATG